MYFQSKKDCFSRAVCASLLFAFHDSLATMLSPRLASLLKTHSRSFYLSIAILPVRIRAEIACAYLLARIADTLADHVHSAPACRLENLRSLGQIIRDKSKFSVPCPMVLPEAEKALIDATDQLMQEISTLDTSRQTHITDLVETIIEGMIFDLSYFSGDTWILHSVDQLNYYTYAVAGCVGKFWTETYMQIIRFKHADTNILKQQAISLGRALQLTNIIRDWPEDRRLGRCYLPREEFERLQVDYELINRTGSGYFNAVTLYWIKQALEYYNEGYSYYCAIPRRYFRMRMAVLWPILFGESTLRLLLRQQDPYNSGKRVKISRYRVFTLIGLSALFGFSNRLTRELIKRA